MAPPKQLRCHDLKSGDIMLQQSLGNLPGRAIAFGQKLTGHAHSEIIHAGIMFDTTYIIEALSDGILANDLRIGNRTCGYVVYRPLSAELATVAGNFAKLLFDTHGITKSLKYSLAGAVASIGASKAAKSDAELDAMVDKIFSAKTDRFFCSQFVVVTYQVAAGQLGLNPSSVMPLDDGKVAPARLMSMLEINRLFSLVGVMAPNQR